MSSALLVLTVAVLYLASVHSFDEYLLSTRHLPRKCPGCWGRGQSIPVTGSVALHTEKCWRATAHRGCLANKLQNPAVEMAAITALLQQKTCFARQPRHKSHARFSFKLP